jgi:DNA-binding transcriptional LysR family regulator
VNDLLALLDLAERGAGVAALPDWAAEGPVGRGTLVRVLPRATLARIPIHLVFPSRRHLPRRVQVVVAALAERPKVVAAPD